MNATVAEGLTRSVEDYLKAIYRLSSGTQPAATSDIANLLDLSPPSVSGMIKRLSEQGLLEHVPYKGVVLTPAGRRLALRTVRRHRLIESYLVAFLGYSWDAVHDEAERLEHAISDELAERMAAALGNPGVDPHGDPIPTADGDIAEVAGMPLSEVPAGMAVEIRRWPRRSRVISCRASGERSGSSSTQAVPATSGLGTIGGRSARWKTKGRTATGGRTGVRGTTSSRAVARFTRSSSTPTSSRVSRIAVARRSTSSA